MNIHHTLEGERVRLRNCRRDDLAFQCEMWLDVENGKYLSDPTRAFVDPVYQKALDELTVSQEGYYLVAELGETGVPIGSAGLFPVEDGIYDIAYCVHKGRWCQGFGGEIIDLLLEWVKEQGGRAVTAEVAKDNLPSNQLLQKRSFSIEKESRFQKYNMNIGYDSYIYIKYMEPQDEPDIPIFTATQPQNAQPISLPARKTQRQRGGPESARADQG